MPRARLSINKGLPARWSLRRGAYYYQVPPGSEPNWDGKKLFRLGTTQPEAYAEYAKRLAHDVRVPKGKTMADLIQRYLLIETPLKAPASQENDHYAARHLLAVFGDVPLTTPFRVSWAYLHVETRKHPRTGKPSPAQGRKEISIMSSILTAGVKWGWIEENRLVGQTRFKGRAGPRRYVTDEEFLRAEALAPAWLKTYLWVKLATGMRQADMRALTWGDVKGDEVSVAPSKTLRSTQKRIIFVLDAYTQAELERLKPGDPDPARPIFSTNRGNAYSKSSFQSAWDRLMRAVVKAGGEKFTEHDIRGKAGSDAASVESAARLLGHASTAVTMRHYRRAAERVKTGS